MAKFLVRGFMVAGFPFASIPFEPPLRGGSVFPSGMEAMLSSGGKAGGHLILIFIIFIIIS
jgi:hypothetical protein